MRRALSAALVGVALLLALAPSSEAGRRRGHWHGGTRVFIGVGPAFWYGYGYHPYWYYGPPYYYTPYVYTPPAVIVQEPPVYVQQAPTPAPAAPQSQAAPPAGYWYYCASAKEYYPRAATCPEAWIKVPPRQE